MSENYFEIKKINQSSLKKILQHPQAYVKATTYDSSDDDDESPSLSMGSLVDCLVTERSKFNQIYHVYDASVVPTEGIKKIVKEVFIENLHEGELKDLKETIITVARRQGFQPKWKDDTMYDNVVRDGEKFYNELKKQGTKIGITPEEKMLANEIADSLLNHPYTKNVFNPSGNKVVIPQLEIEWEYRNKECKSKLDVVTIDYDNKLVIPTDVKTTKDMLTLFMQKSFHKYRYDFQAGFYMLALQHWIKNHEDAEIRTFTLAPFQFAIESTVYPGTPLLYTIKSPELYAILDYEYEGRKYSGIETAFDLIEWHTENNLWEYPKEVYLCNGNIEV